MTELFKPNTLKRLVLMNCDSLNDDSLSALMEGVDEKVDVHTDRPIVAPRKFKHLDLTRCRSITDTGLKTLVNNIPSLQSLLSAVGSPGPVLFAPGFISCLLSRTSPLGLVRAPFSI
jgi:hypothetical protein